MIPYGKQSISDEDIDAVVDVLKSDFLTTGPKIREFEDKFSRYVGSKYAVAVSNGTAALHLACLASGLGKDDELITSPITFAASANCALYCNAKPVFVDTKDNGLIDEDKIERKISSKTRVIIPVHYSGMVCNLEKIRTIAEKHNLVVIEDACHALGTDYLGSKIGCCSHSDMAVFSFHPVKHITTGEGGMITTNSKEIYDKLVMLRSHGIVKNRDDLSKKDEGGWFYEMQMLGYNYRMTDIQCALGISQLSKIDSFVEKRRKIAGIYNDSFHNLDEVSPIVGNLHESSYHLYVIKVKNKDVRRELYDFLLSKNISCQIHYIPVYLHPYYIKNGYKVSDCKIAEDFYDKILSIPIYPDLSEDDQQFVIDNINGFYKDGIKK